MLIYWSGNAGGKLAAGLQPSTLISTICLYVVSKNTTEFVSP